MREVSYSEAIREALTEEMERDEAVFLMGEDLGVYGGCFGVTQGLLDRFGPERVIDTPISEGSFVGMAVGAALTGSRPVVEIMFADFITLAMDQIINHAAKFRQVYGEQAKVALVIRCAAGGGRRYGPTHSQNPEAWFVHTPGLKVVAPSTPADAKGLLKSAIRDDDPVIFLENKMLYPQKGQVPDREYLVPLGQAACVREGNDLTLVAYSRMVQEALEAAARLEQEGISAEVIDLRTLSPLDIGTVVESVRKTNRVLVVHEACRTGGVGAEVAAQIFEQAFDYLDAPLRRLTAPDIAIPFSPELEDWALPNAADIVAEARKLLP